MKLDEEYFKTAFILTIMFGCFWSLGMSFIDGATFTEVFWPAGLGFGAISGLIIAPIFRKVEFEGKVNDIEEFKLRLKNEMAKLSFELEQDIKDQMVFKPTSVIDFSLGAINFLPANMNKITVNFKGENITIIGTSGMIKKSRPIFESILKAGQ